ncbi:type II secretion system F family protein [Helicovermis profundi]|uniref:Type II secretion system F family protein n=1 Tax=Helicovermis profundi TaxID=3065157 RepID=A0AAU9ERP9_9FIRM|nr:type II secretion system F family protein [Clostridia bacterium S502]
MLYLFTLIFFLTIVFFINGIAYIFFSNSFMIEKRVKKLSENTSISNESFNERIMSPFIKNISTMFTKLISKNRYNKIKLRIESLGISKKEEVKFWIYKKNMTSILGFIIAFVFAYILNKNIINSLILSIFIFILVNVIFNFYLSRKISIRKKKIIRDLPFVLDLILVSVEAGLSFDGAINRVVDSVKSELSIEFEKTLKEIKMGIPRKKSLKNLSLRCDSKEIYSFVTSIIQADELGVSIGKVLRIEASQLRERRKQIAREKAMKAPVKMLIPLIIFVFPSIFIIILGPALINISRIFR